MSLIRVLTLDFWNTLYSHATTARYRSVRRQEVIRALCRERRLTHGEEIARTFFQTIENYVASEWKRNMSPSMDSVLEMCGEKFPSLTRDDSEKLVRAIEHLYQHDLKPTFSRGASSFIEDVSERYSLYMVSDTSFLRGQVLRKILEKDRLVRYFKDTMFSDEVGHRKPDPYAFNIILKREQCKPGNAIHVGDDIRTDYEAARRIGMKFIHYVRKREAMDARVFVSATDVLGVAHSFGDLREILGREG